MAHKFIKCKSKSRPIIYDDWRLVIDNHKDLNEYHFSVKMGIDKKVMEDALCAADPEYKTRFSATDQLLAIEELTGKGALQISADWSSRGFMSKFKMIAQGIPVIINDMGGYMLLTDDIEITDTIMAPSMVKPKFTVDDIKVSKFRGGSHWYAQLSWLDVEIDGRGKWNSYDAAHQAALKYLDTF